MSALDVTCVERLACPRWSAARRAPRAARRAVGGALTYGALLARRAARRGGAARAGVAAGDRVAIAHRRRARRSPSRCTPACCSARSRCPSTSRLGAERGGAAVRRRARSCSTRRARAPGSRRRRRGDAPSGGETHDLDAPAIVVHTSGTSSQPKPVALTYGNWLWSALGSAAALGVDPRERWLCCLPLSHVGGLSILLRSAIYGTTAVVHERFDTQRVLDALATRTARRSSRSCRRRSRGCSTPGCATRRRCAGRCSAARPIPARCSSAPRAAGVPVAPTYGMTEACSQVATFGRPLFCTRVRTAPDGELLVAGRRRSGRRRRGWRPATSARSTPSGAIVVTGRKSDTIITGGENVAPQEVEACSRRIRAVAEAAVHGRADAEWGEALVAHVVLRAGEQATSEDCARSALSGSRRSRSRRRSRSSAACPRTASGKLAPQPSAGTT